jgi:anti-anti-sigma regulatory factor
MRHIALLPMLSHCVRDTIDHRNVQDECVFCVKTNSIEPQRIGLLAFFIEHMKHFMSYDLSRFSSADAVNLSLQLRRLGATAANLTDVASNVVRYLFEQFRDDSTGARCCALVRVYSLTSYGVLDAVRQRFAAKLCDDTAPTNSTPCLSLLATAGEEAAWNSPLTSNGHLAIPLPSPEFVTRLPMVHALLASLGVDVSKLFQVGADMGVRFVEGDLGVFHVPEAREAPSIPAQQFVVKHGIRSVIGFGGALPSGDIFAMLVFSKVPIASDVCELFKTVALGMKLALLRVGQTTLTHAPIDAGVADLQMSVTSRERFDALEKLIDAQEHVAEIQTAHIENLVMELGNKLNAERERAETLERLQLTVEKLSTPILEVWDDVLALPLIGVLDSQRTAHLMERLLEEVGRRACQYVIIDVTGIDTVDSTIADYLVRIVRAVELLGTKCVLTGIRPSVAQTLVELGANLGNLRTLRNLKHGLRHCIGASIRDARI